MVLAPRARACSTRADCRAGSSISSGQCSTVSGTTPASRARRELLVAVDDGAALLLAHPAPAQREHRPQAGVRRGGHVQLGHGGPSIPWVREGLLHARIRVERAGEQHETATPTRTRGRRLGRAFAYAVPVAVVLFGVGFLVRSKWGPLQNLDDAIIAADHVVHPPARRAPVLPRRLAVAHPADPALHRRHPALPVGVAGQGAAHPGLVGLRHDDGRLVHRAGRQVRRSSGPARSSRTPSRRPRATPSPRGTP